MNRIGTKALIALLLFVYSCTFQNFYVNREKDNQEGKAFLNQFYDNIAAKNFGKIDAAMSDSLRQLVGNDGISKLANYINSKVGNYDSFTVVDFYIRATVGTVNEISYAYKLIVKYEKGTIDEVIGLQKQNGGTIKLNGYHAYSDQLIH